MTPLKWRFSGFSYDLQSGLMFGQEPVHLARKERALIELLLRARGMLVSKDAIIQAVWAGGAVSDESVSRCIYTMRRALRDQGCGDVVKTVYGGGVRICVDIEEDFGRLAWDPMCPGPSSPSDAIRLWRMGWEQAGGRSRIGLEQAMRTFARAYDADPDSAAIPLTMLACCMDQASRGYVGAAAAAQAAERVLARVLHRNPGYAPAIACRAWFQAVAGRELAGALTQLDWAVEAMPHDYHAGFCRAFVLSGLGRLEEAVLEVKRGVRAMAPDRGYMAAYAWHLFCAGRLGEAVDFAGEALEMRPDNDVLHAIASSAHALRGDAAAALAAATNAVAVSGGNAPALAALAYAHAACGQAQAALAILGRLGPAEAPDGCPACMTAPVWLALGERGRAAAALQQSDDLREPLFFYAQYDPRLAGLSVRAPAPDRGAVLDLQRSI